MIDSELEFGAQVEFDTYLVRRTGSRAYKWRKEWVPFPADVPGFARKVLRGMIIGSRLISNGTNHTGDYGIEYQAEEYIYVYLVAYDMLRNPVYVKPEDLTGPLLNE